MSHSYEDGSVLGLNHPETRLTPREREIADLLAIGLSNDEIAERLVLTSGSVANYIARILEKLDLRSRLQVAITFATRRRTRDLDDILALLAHLREFAATDPMSVLQHATDLLASAFSADKVDAFVYESETDMLVALGTSQTPLRHTQRELGLHRRPLSRAGRVGWVFGHSQAYANGHVETDSVELVAIRRDLSVRSSMMVPLHVASNQHGVLVVESQGPEHFGESELRLLQFVTYWVGLVAQR